MLEKLKNIAKSVQAIIGYAFAILIMAIAGLLFKNRRLEQKIEEEQKDAKIKELDGQQKEVDKMAGDAVSDYQRAVDEFKRRSGQS